MIGLVRMHCYRSGVFWLCDVPVADAKRKRRELAQTGWVITHSEVV
tara:strand:+ start:336 stop:473 length:138 start_codon:yes stop_codon:yes gene_type:complete